MTQSALRSWVLCAGTVVLCGVVVCVAGAGDEEAKLAQIKAAYVLNFMKFTTWPKQAMPAGDGPIELAVVGEDTLGEYLDATFQDRTVHDHPVRITRHALPSQSRSRDEKDDPRAVTSLLQAIKGKHVVYMSLSNQRWSQRLIEGLDGGHTLLITETMDDVRDGAMLGLAVERGRVVFYANAHALKRAEVEVSSKVLRLARLVKDERR